MRPLLYISLILLAGCRYADFASIDPAPSVAWVISAQLAELSEQPTPIYSSMVVEGVVVANDSTGNFYKQIMVTDRAQSSALAISIGYYDSYSQFPVGQIVAVQLQGLVLRKVDGLLTAGYPPQVGDTIPAPIATFALVERHIHLQGAYFDLPLAERRFDELRAADIGLPFLFTEVYMQSPLGSYAGERIVCRVPTDTVAILYTSPYATFANMPVPQSAFDMRAVVTSFKNKIQLKILQSPEH